MTDAADPGPDEDPPTPGAGAKRLRRLRVDILVGLLVIGGGFVIARALSHGDHGARPTPSPTVSVASASTR